MTSPVLSVVVPAYNEAAGIDTAITRLVDYLTGSSRDWELLVVDDGSEDETAAIVGKRCESEPRLRLVNAPHGGKGAAVRRGMLEARGRYRFICDADLSMPPEHIERFFDGSDGNPSFDVAVGSREAPGARRIGEPWRRHFIGRVFNWVVRIFAVRGIQDTQCGFKLFGEDAANQIFRLQKLDGWAFDVEVLYLARKAGYSVGEIAIDWWFAKRSSRVSLVLGGIAFLQILKIRLNDLRGEYSGLKRVDK